MSYNFNKKFRCITMVILLVLSALLASSELNALMPLEKEKGSRQISTLQDIEKKEGGFTFKIYEEGEKEIPPEEEAREAVSEEENTAIEKKIADEIKRTKEEKKRIIEEVKEEESFPEFPQPKRPFIVEEEVVEARLSKPKEKKIEPLDAHNIILGDNPLLLVLFLLVLSVILYYVYRFTMKK